MKKNFSLNEHELNIFRKIINWPKVVEIASSNLNPTEYHFIYMNWQFYFIRTGVKAMTIQSTNLLLMKN